MYRWTQTLEDVTVVYLVPEGTRGRDLDVRITEKSLQFGFKGKEPIFTGTLCKPCVEDESFWSVVDGRELTMTLTKAKGMEWWKAVCVGDPEIDTQKVTPEDSKLSDLDPETRATVEKMMFDQRQKQMGLPTSEEIQKQEMMRKFMEQHPEMDFSGAKINY